MARVMEETWVFRSTPDISVQDIDLTGYKVEGTDGSVGKVDEATYEAGGSYLVVDTGPWILGRKVMLPAGMVSRIDADEAQIYVDLTKDQIKNSPEFDPDRQRDDLAYRDRLAEYYGGR